MNILEALASAAHDDGDDTSGLTPEQQVIRLREVVAKRAEGHTFTEGQIIRHKYPSLSGMRSADQPHIFLGYLAAPIDAALVAAATDVEGLYSTAATRILDARMGCITRRGEGYDEYLMDSREFEPHPDFPDATIN